MSSAKRPGEYVADIPLLSGGFRAECRCPVCWHTFDEMQGSHVEMLLGDSVDLTCPLCGETREYTDASKGTATTSAPEGQSPKVREKRIEADPPLFSGFDPGYDLRHKRTDRIQRRRK